MPGVVPRCLSLVPCEAVEYRGRERVNLLGLLWSLRLPSFPIDTGPFRVWIELTDGHGPTLLRLRLALMTPDLVDGFEVFGSRFTVAFGDPREAYPHVVRVDTVELPAAGRYRFSVLAGAQAIAERYLTVFHQRFEGGAADVRPRPDS